MIVLLDILSNLTNVFAYLMMISFKLKKMKSQIFIQFHFWTMTEPINSVFSLDTFRVLEAVV